MPASSSAGASRRSQRAATSPGLRFGAVTSRRPLSITSKIPSTTTLAGNFFPSKATGSASLSQISVSIAPGVTSPTWMPEPYRSLHSPAVNASIAAFDAAYTASRGGATTAAKDDTFTTTPPPAFSMWGIAANVHHTHDMKFTSITRATSRALVW